MLCPCLCIKAAYKLVVNANLFFIRPLVAPDKTAFLMPPLVDSLDAMGVLGLFLLLFQCLMWRVQP